MQIRNQHLLREFRVAGYCEMCHLYVKIREPHHVKTKGTGGNSVLDVRCNLLSVGGSCKLPDGRRRFTCSCHHDFHAGKIPTAKLLAIVGERESVCVEVITEVLDWMHRLIKPTPSELREALEELTPPAWVLATRELVEAGVMADRFAGA